MLLLRSVDFFLHLYMTTAHTSVDFAHLHNLFKQEQEQEHMLLLARCQQTCMTYSIVVCTVKRPATSSVHYITSCKHSLVLLRMGKIIARNMLS